MSSSTPPRVLVITSNAGVERDELMVPLEDLRGSGAHVVHAASRNSTVQTMLHDTDNDLAVTPDADLDSVVSDDFDALVVPGGTVNADTIRRDDRAVALARDFASGGKPVAVICHGPWLLIEADLAGDRTLTSYTSLQTDLRNAGAEWIDDSMVRSEGDGWTLITSRGPGDLEDFTGALVTELGMAS